jgi:hypothetical protein
MITFSEVLLIVEFVFHLFIFDSTIFENIKHIEFTNIGEILIKELKQLSIKQDTVIHAIDTS